MRDVRIVFENCSESIFDDDGDLEIGAIRFEEPERRSREHTIAERPETDDGNASATWQPL